MKIMENIISQFPFGYINEHSYTIQVSKKFQNGKITRN